MSHAPVLVSRLVSGFVSGLVSGFGVFLGVFQALVDILVGMNSIGALEGNRAYWLKGCLLLPASEHAKGETPARSGGLDSAQVRTGLVVVATQQRVNRRPSR